MKKISVLFLTLLLISSFSFVLGIPSDGIDESDKGKIDNLVGEIPIDPDTGKFDPGRFNGTLTMAEERINEINLWLDSNVGWMKYIFHIKPAISWLFFFNIYFILLFFLILILNVQGLFFFMSNKTSARLFGLGLFLVFMITGFYVGLARILESWKIYIFEVLIPSSIILGIILIIVYVGLFIFAYPVVVAILEFIKSYFAAKEEAKKAMELSSGIVAINKLVKGATG